MVQDLGRVHRRYIDLSNRFKSAWTFHQFLQGLKKVFPESAPQTYDVDFQSVYGQLKHVSENLNETSVATVAGELDTVASRLEELIRPLLGADERISPRLLRQFFQRVKNFDDNILSQLVKFYLYSNDGNGWNDDRLDKADFVTTKLCEDYVEGRNIFVARDPGHLRAVTEGFWTALGAQPMSEEELAELRGELESQRRAVAGVDSIDDLYGGGMVQRYRQFKHDLGDRFFQPKVLQEIIDTNLAYKNAIHELYRREEERIVAEYQHVFELEREVPVDVQLQQELSDFRHAVERFEKQIEGSSVRLEELGSLRAKVRELIPKLTSEGEGSEPMVEPREVREMRQKEEALAAPTPGSEDAYVEDAYQQIIGTLDDTNPTLDARKVTLQPEVFGLGVKPREILAYRRLYGGATCDRQLEELLLRAAAMRYRIEQEVEEIKSILDESAVTRDSPVFAQARVTCRVADFFLRRFEHAQEQLVLRGDLTEAQAVQKLKMRMMRVYAGLWLMAHE